MTFDLKAWRARQRDALASEEVKRRHRMRKRLADVNPIPKPSTHPSIYCTIGGHARCPRGKCDCPCH